MTIYEHVFVGKCCDALQKPVYNKKKRSVTDYTIVLKEKEKNLQ